ncbi:MAG TPA: methyltransferase domain-containing protein [Phycisphaerales bacterium]|nr:methyltransferase domain-containing protein [Phycisphaerales bacterium]HRQ76529.1 methyltransferase domain-containing protein [Phycisphaerales bacterium]
MIRQSLKDIYFAAARFATLPNTLLARFRYRNSAPGSLCVHLGCGPHYLDGMINIDGNLRRKKDLWLDLRNPLPFPNRSVSLVYCSHMIEHVFPEQALALLREVYRILSDDGVARFAVPCMEHALAITRGEATMPFPRPFEDPLAQAINYLFCDGQHKFGYSWAVMQDFAMQAGFTRVTNYSAKHGVTPKSYGSITLGNEPAGSLVVELQR